MKSPQIVSSLHKATLLALVLIGFGARAIDFPDETGDELRLRLGDRVQELRTTSVNWLDLVAPAPQAKETDVKPPPTHKFRVVVDAGHGGRDLGATGYGVLE